MTRFIATSGRPKHRDTCIFCGKRDFLTGEHLFAQWIGKGLGLPFAPTMEAHLATPEKEELKFVDLKKLGGYVNARLNVLCEHCNNQWGSVLQQQASQILKPLLASERWRATSDECSCIASWVTSFMMVRQFLHPALAVLDVAQRRHFCQTKKPLDSLALWVGYFGGEREQLATWYSALSVSASSKPSKPNSFICGFTIGCFVFLAYGSGTKVDLNACTELTSVLQTRLIQLGLIPVWPSTPLPPVSEPLVLSDLDFNDLVPLLKRCMLDPLEPLNVSRDVVERERDLTITDEQKSVLAEAFREGNAELVVASDHSGLILRLKKEHLVAIRLAFPNDFLRF